jgi:hypothetical protein
LLISLVDVAALVFNPGSCFQVFYDQSQLTEGGPESLTPDQVVYTTQRMLPQDGSYHQARRHQSSTVANRQTLGRSSRSLMPSCVRSSSQNHCSPETELGGLLRSGTPAPGQLPRASQTRASRCACCAVECTQEVIQAPALPSVLVGPYHLRHAAMAPACAQRERVDRPSCTLSAGKKGRPACPHRTGSTCTARHATSMALTVGMARHGM